jgi:primase/DNA polymerase family protein/AAA domain-containing protein
LSKPKPTQFKNSKCAVEIYHGGWAGKALTVTGNHYSGGEITGIEPERFELVHLLCSQIRDEKFKALWMGDTSAYGSDDSSADMALCCKLARLLNYNPEKIDAAFRWSKLMRPKWQDNGGYYKNLTISKAIEWETTRDQSPQPASNQSSSRELKFHLPAVESRSHREYVISPATGQKDGWFPLGAVSLVGGPSGGSKTTWMLQLLITQMSRIPFQGHATYGRSFLMVGADRGEDAHKRTLERMNLTLVSIPFKPLRLAWDLDAAQAIVDQIEATSPLPEIVFVEGVDMLVTDVNNIKAVAYFVHALQRIAQHYRIALIGSLGSPKVKEGHGYTATRDNLLGSGGWGRTVETVALLQFPKNDDTSGRRQLTVVLRNAPAEKFTLAFVDGLLEVQPDSHDEEKTESGPESVDVEWYKEQARLAKDDPSKRWWTILDMERALNLSHPTADRHVKHDYTKRHLLKKTKGQRRGGRAVEYRWNDSKTNPLWLAQQKQERAEQSEAF